MLKELEQGKPITYDLIYSDGKSIFDLIKKRWPEAEWEDARDFIHEERHAVKFLNEATAPTPKEYYKFLIKNGFSNLSLTFELALGLETERPIIKNILEELKKEKESINGSRS